MAALSDTGAREVKLIEIEGLSKHFPIKYRVTDALSGKKRRYVRAVNDVSFSIYKGESLGLVGESGCGKSTLAKSIIRLYEPTSGKIVFRGKDITHLRGKALNAERPAMQMIFQDPYSSLNPRMTVYEIIAEMLKVHRKVPKDRIRDRTAELIETCGLGMEVADRFPGEFSGGQRQRIGIARALSLEPELILADEPVSALDVSIQAQIINLLSSLQKRLDLSLLFISHDLRVVRHITRRVAVMYLGKVVELGETEAIFSMPLHPYTSVLMKAAPVLDPRNRVRDYAIEGEPPSPIDLPSGCPFHPRCTRCRELCSREEPALLAASGGRLVACHYPLIDTERSLT
jgi:oligopeptide/dipeptide ABC transporter, ATP-binding protein, C-terminal domain